jgi:hypothetical protein
MRPRKVVNWEHGATGNMEPNEAFGRIYSGAVNEEATRTSLSRLKARVLLRRFANQDNHKRAFVLTDLIADRANLVSAEQSGTG